MADLQRELQQLRQQLDEVQRSQHRQAAPFRRRHRSPRPKKPGRSEGHAPAHRPPPDHVDAVQYVPLPACPQCQGPIQDKTVHVQYQTDLPPVRPVVTQFHLEAGYCPRCRRRVQARHPEQISDATGAAAHVFGPRVLALAVEMKHRLGVPYRKITDVLASYFHFEASHGAFVRACNRIARRGLPTFYALVETLRHSAVVHSDSTGWRIGGMGAWLWVFSAARATVYWVSPGHGQDVPRQVLGPDFDGLLVCDGAKEFDALEEYAKARCLGHVLRRCHELRSVVSAAEAADVAALQGLLQKAIDLGQRRETLTAVGYARRVQEVENRLDAWLHARRRCEGPELRRLIDHLCGHRGEWLVFLHEAGVPPTNNHAEQMLRPAVVSRKIGGCNQTDQGAATHSVLSSILVTVKRVGQTFVDWAVPWLRQGQTTAWPA